MSLPEEKMLQSMFGMLNDAMSSGDIKLILKVKPNEAVEISKLLVAMRGERKVGQ